MKKNKRVKINFFTPRILPNSRKGLSAIITTLILIALTISVIAVVWATVTNLLTDKLNTAKSCMNIFDKIELNKLYTCYDGSNFQFSIDIGEIDVEEIIVIIYGDGLTKRYNLNKTDTIILGLGPYPSGSGGVKLPEKNSGKTYISNEFSIKPDSIKIIPIINGNQCEVSDTILEIYSC